MKKAVVATLLIFTVFSSAACAAFRSLESVRTLDDVELLVGAGVRGNDGTEYVVYTQAPRGFTVSKWVRVNTPEYPREFAPVGAVVPMGTACTIRLHLENIQAEAKGGVQVSSLDDLSRVATKIADVFDIGGKTVTIVDNQPVIQDWYFHEGVKGVVFQPSITTYREYIYHDVISEEFASTGEPMRETNLFDYTGKLRVVVPELYQKITLRTLKDAELLVKQWGAWPQFSNDGQSASVFIESDWVVSDGFVATRTDEVSGSVTTYQAGEIVPRGVVTLKQSEQK